MLLKDYAKFQKQKDYNHQEILVSELYFEFYLISKLYINIVVNTFSDILNSHEVLDGVCVV